MNKIHGTIIRIGGGPDKQGHVFSDPGGVLADLQGSWLSKNLQDSGIKNIIPGTRITKVVVRRDRIDVEVNINPDTCPTPPEFFTTAFFAAGGKILQKSGDSDLTTIEKCEIKELSITLNGVDPAYTVKLGPLGD